MVRVWAECGAVVGGAECGEVEVLAGRGVAAGAGVAAVPVLHGRRGSKSVLPFLPQLPGAAVRLRPATAGGDCLCLPRSVMRERERNGRVHSLI